MANFGNRGSASGTANFWVFAVPCTQNCVLPQTPNPSPTTTLGFYPAVSVGGDVWNNSVPLNGAVVPTGMRPGVYWVVNWFDLENTVSEWKEYNNISTAFTQLVVLNPGACP